MCLKRSTYQHQEVATGSLWSHQEDNSEGFEVLSRKTKGSEHRLFLHAASLHNYRDGIDLSGIKKQMILIKDIEVFLSNYVIAKEVLPLVSAKTVVIRFNGQIKEMTEILKTAIEKLQIP